MSEWNPVERIVTQCWISVHRGSDSQKSWSVIDKKDIKILSLSGLKGAINKMCYCYMTKERPCESVGLVHGFIFNKLALILFMQT